MLLIAKQSLVAKDKATQLHTPIKDRKKTFYEVGNGNPKAMSLLESLLKIHGNNEIRALDTAAHCQQAIEIFLTEVREKGHVANLDDLAKQAADSDDADEGEAEPAEKTLAQTITDTWAQDNPGIDPDVPPPPAEGKPKRARAKKPVEAAAEVNDEVPPVPPADDFDDDTIRPAFLRQREKDREAEAESVH